MSNTRVITPKAAKRAIKHSIIKHRPIFIWGAPGIGKSDIVRQIGKELNREVIDIRLTLCSDASDLKGIPYHNKTLNVMSWAPPLDLPSDPNSTAIILLDELNSAPLDIQCAAYQLTLDRRIGNYVLPKNVDIVAAGNRECDNGVTNAMPSPLANRFIHLEMKHDYADWEEWAIENNIHPDVIGYLGAYKGDLYNFSPNSSDTSFATPRSWFAVSELLDDEDVVDYDTLHNLISGAIGDGLAIKFMAHRTIATKLPRADEILDGTVTDLEIKEISAMYSLVIALCYELKLRQNKTENWDEIVDNFFFFLMNNMTTELIVMGIYTAMVKYSLQLNSAKMKSYAQFSEKYAKYITQALQNNKK